MKRWGQLISDRCADRGWVTDPVYDLARILRVPGSTNHKYRDKPVRARMEVTEGVPLTYDEVTELLAEHERSAPKLRKIQIEGKAAKPAASNQAVRKWLDKRAGFQRPATPYGAKALAGLLAEYGTTTEARHPWMVRSVIRAVELADRGDLDGHQALTVIRDRFTEAINGERAVVGEFAAAVRHAVGQLDPPALGKNEESKPGDDYDNEGRLKVDGREPQPGRRRRRRRRQHPADGNDPPRLFSMGPAAVVMLRGGKLHAARRGRLAVLRRQAGHVHRVPPERRADRRPAWRGHEADPVRGDPRAAAARRHRDHSLP